MVVLFAEIGDTKGLYQIYRVEIEHFFAKDWYQGISGMEREILEVISFMVVL